MIPSIILEEAKTFVTFMQSMVEELIGNEEVMLAIARASGNHIEGYGDESSESGNEEKSSEGA
jgi:predicted lactoylglutathione lyase